VFPGEGQIRFRGFEGTAAYEITGDPATLRLGPLRLRGWASLDPETAQEAFRAGEAELMLENGHNYRLSMIGHTTGSELVYFEMRI
jgi:hypothetical protein